MVVGSFLLPQLLDVPWLAFSPWSSEARAQKTEGRIPWSIIKFWSCRDPAYSWAPSQAASTLHLCLNRKARPAPAQGADRGTFKRCRNVKHWCFCKKYGLAPGYHLIKENYLHKWIIMRHWNHERLKVWFISKSSPEKQACFKNIKKGFVFRNCTMLYSHNSLSKQPG